MTSVEFAMINTICQHASAIYRGLDLLWETPHGSEYISQFSWDNNHNQNLTPGIILGLKNECKTVFSLYETYVLRAAPWIRQDVNNSAGISDFIHERLPLNHPADDAQILIDALRYIYPANRRNLISSDRMRRLDQYSQS